MRQRRLPDQMSNFIRNLGRLAIVVGCLYEAFSIPHRTPTPTITKVVKRSQHHAAGRVATAVWLIVWVHHFIETERIS